MNSDIEAKQQETKSIKVRLNQGWFAPMIRQRVPFLSLLLITFFGTLMLYTFTAAPDVLSGDSGEFQFAAPLLAVPHPTGYPLYILLGKLATYLPIGSIAYRVTLVSVLAGAATVLLLALLVQAITRNYLAALIAAVALAMSPGMWNAATLAEVYTLNMLLLTLLAWLLWHAHARQNVRLLSAAACVTGLGFSLHGSFLLIGVPLLVFYAVIPLFWCPFAGGEYWLVHRKRSRVLIHLVLWGAVGLLPWLFILLQYVRLGPFNGIDHGLHRYQDVAHPTYFWGAPISWAEAIDHLFGGVIRGGIFNLPSLERLQIALPLLAEHLWFEGGPLGILLGVIGCVLLLRQAPLLWIGCGWVAGATLLYFLTLGQAVQDALMFTIPFLLPWTLWMGSAAAAIASKKNSKPRSSRPLTPDPRPLTPDPHPPTLDRHSAFCILHSPFSAPDSRTFMLSLLLLLTLAWGASRWPYSNKNHLWLFRTFGEGVLHHMAPDAVVMVRWEQGTILQYLRLVEGQRPDVWVDIVEPGDEAWRERAQRRYSDDTVYIIGNQADGAELGAQRVWETEYAILYRLQ